MLFTVCNVECMSWKTLITFICSLNFTIDDFFLKRIACRGPQAYRETINQFPGKQVQSWSHASWVTNGELFAKKGFAIPFLKHRQEGEREKNHKSNCKALCIKRKRNEFQLIIALFHISICSELFEKSIIHDIYASFDTNLS